jgi:hypothetical protein
LQGSPAPSEKQSPRGLPAFIALLVGIIVLNLAVGTLVVPLADIKFVSLIVTIFAVALPIFALFAGANAPWDWKRAVALVAIGVAIQAGGNLLGLRLGHTVVAGLILAIAQSGLVIWCLGLGGLIATVLKDKNLLLPLAIFLAMFDVWLVFVPEGPVGQIARKAATQTTVLQHFAYRVPLVTHVSQGGPPEAYAYIGPADFVFTAMFFVALYRFSMRSKQTLYAMVPTLIGYLLIVLFLGSVHFGPITLQAMPALLPIGAVVLAVNWKEFKLTRDEIQSTVGLAVIGFALVSWRLWLHWNDYKPRLEIVRPPDAPGYARPLNSPPPKPQGQSPSQSPPGPIST